MMSSLPRKQRRWIYGYFLAALVVLVVAAVIVIAGLTRPTFSPNITTPAVLALVAATLVAGTAYRQRRHAAQQDRKSENERWQAAEMAAYEATEEQQAYEAMVRLAAIVSSSSDAIVGKTLEGIVTSWNAAAEHIFGYTTAEMVGQSIFKLIPEEWHEAERQLLERLRLGEVVEFSEAERIRKDGERIWISLSVSPVRDRSGTITGAASIKRDITERKKAEAERRQNQEQLWLAHRAARLGTWRWDIDADVLRWDDGLRQLFGVDTDITITAYRDFIQWVHPEDRARVNESVQQAITNSGTLDDEFRIVLPDGQVRWLADLGRVTVDEHGGYRYLTGVCMDVTERKLMEERLRDTQRLQAVGQLAGGIAHEANNQMTVILGATQFLLRQADIGSSTRTDIEYIRRAAERTASITRQLLAFSRRQVLRLQNLDPDAVVHAIAPVLRRSLSENQHLEIRTGLRGRLVRADASQLEQVLLNLTLNARDAMPDGGRLTIETSEVMVDSDAAAHDDSLAAGTYATIQVKDTGNGMDPGTLRRIFEPFFTTKDVGQGTGLGLAVVHGIISQIGGHIHVESTPGRGTTFALYFPLVSSKVATATTELATVPMPAASGKAVLVVEDDPVVRSMVSRSLIDAGYTVLEASNGQEALALIRDRGPSLDIVVTDVGMPELNGHELARRLQDERPALPVLLMSGYGDTVTAHPFLQKPFAPDVLVRKVGEVIEAVVSAPPG